MQLNGCVFKSEIPRIHPAKLHFTAFSDGLSIEEPIKLPKLRQKQEAAVGSCPGKATEQDNEET